MEVEKLSDLGATNRSGDRDRDDPEHHSHCATTINDLPAETLSELFGWLTHTEKLISRLVCQRWNDQILSFLIKHSFYILASRESLQVVLDSYVGGVQWTKIRISDHGFILPSQFKNSITALEVHLPKFRSRLSEYITYLTEFPCLTNLKMIVDGGGSDDIFNVTDAENLALYEHLKTIFEKLEILEITVPSGKYFVLCDFFQRISTLPMHLNTLCITEERRPSNVERQIANYDSKRSYAYFPLYLYHTILITAHTLKSLTLNFASKPIQNVLFKKIIPAINKKNKVLKLESVVIHRGRHRENIEHDFTNLQNFLKKQASLGELKYLVLPWCPDASLCQEFVRCLPPDIEVVGNLRDEHITDEFPTTFKKLKTLTIDSIQSGLTRQLFVGPVDNVRRLLGKLKSNTFKPELLYENLANNLSNLSEIRFVGINILIFDPDLRQIINQLSKHLRVLHLESCKITDFGVLGIREDDVELQELIRTKRLYCHQTPNEDLLVKVTQPLSYLRKLEKLVLLGTNITDVGIILGFKFGLTLKQLILKSESPEVTDFGLHSLGLNNPGLEAFQGSFKSGKISKVGIDKFKKQLRLTESTRKFKVVNEIPGI